MSGNSRTIVHGAYGVYYDNVITGAAGIGYIINGRQGVRTLVARFPTPIAAWNTLGHKLPEAPGGTAPSLVIPLDPALKRIVTPIKSRRAFSANYQVRSVWPPPTCRSAGSTS